MHIYAAQSRQSNSAWASTVCVAFTRSRLATFAISPIRRFTALPPPGPRFLLSHEELATLWHPPTAGVTAEKMRVADYTELKAPAFLPSGAAAGEIVVGQVQHRSDRRIFGQARDDRRRHVHIVGRTRVGKTTLLLNQIHADIASGQGVGLIDPHGDLADTVLLPGPPDVHFHGLQSIGVYHSLRSTDQRPLNADGSRSRVAAVRNFQSPWA